jgi:hypothetical protein
MTLTFSSLTVWDMQTDTVRIYDPPNKVLDFRGSGERPAVLKPENSNNNSSIHPAVIIDLQQRAREAAKRFKS